MRSVNFSKGLYFFEPKPQPVFDDKGNVISYIRPSCTAMTLQDSSELRVKSFPNELGMSADPNNVTGFGALLDVLNQHRNTRTSGTSQIGSDDADCMRQVVERQKIVKQISKGKQ